ncbi:Glucose-6-phosphate isomerase [Acididesulfobacillus acetoxydans]|uniref:Glucose-6-phosphate isomerase n=1 Tax=Acididesulfobacillus acetoxydans TaxID=1561005 RepID=A0A8S0VWD8_9FIRM|nr:glucose-6-phosphate isomerase [Acididesulfobacillus acetoxydans]CAA7600753.1 Glucose-6-phosphate isomerase [Acididesulfobacillus acetoxydans]CEJ07993.1 Glucose-6-phosphate isomerase [Acididesulfobacillus acetoxydans]
MGIELDYTNIAAFVSKSEIDAAIESKKRLMEHLLAPVKENTDSLGWIDPNTLVNQKLLTSIQKKAEEIREKADIFVLIGVGGSNQGARALIEAMGDGKVEILYAGNNLSPKYLGKIMSRLAEKSVYVNVIAKNFATLEPGIAFRVLRHYMEQRYGLEEAARRTIATGTLNSSSLEQLGKMKGYTLLPFPLNVGGRYSVLSAVGLLPIAVAGIEIGELLKGARDEKKVIHSRIPAKNPAVIYGALRNILLAKGYRIEILSYFEPSLSYFAKWWVQLFAETEGKDGRGIYPSMCSFTEDLHSLGQYIQEGPRILFETFLNFENERAHYSLPREERDLDGFSYIEGKDFAHLNRTAFEATVGAHVEGGVPCLILNIPELTPYNMGQLFYFFEYACYVSASLLGVNPFNQPGVEAYKSKMFAALGRSVDI